MAAGKMRRASLTPLSGVSGVMETLFGYFGQEDTGSSSFEPVVSEDFNLTQNVSDFGSNLDVHTQADTSSNTQCEGNTNSSTSGNIKAKTSIRLFREFLVRRPDGTLDASRIHSKECYLAWLHSRKIPSNEPEKSFQRTLSSHLTGVDGRSPFTPEEEEAILRVLRKKERWPCFAESKVSFGHTGFRAQGYHERQRQETAQSTAASVAPKKRAASVDIHEPKRVCRLSIDSPGTPHPPNEVAPPVVENPIQETIAPALQGGPLPRDQDAIIKRFFEMAQGMFMSASLVSNGVVKFGFYAFRTLLNALGLCRPYSQDDVERLYTWFTEKYPDDAVFIVDAFASDFRDRYLRLNHVAKSIFGDITCDNGGAPTRIFQEDDTKRIMSFLLSMLRKRGKGEVVLAPLSMCSGKEDVEKPFEVAFFLDSETSLIAMHGRPLYWRPALGLS